VKAGILSGLAGCLVRTAGDVFGSDTLHIDGGGGVEAIRGDINRGEDYPDDVGEPQTSLQVVITTTEFEAVYSGHPFSYVRKLCNFEGETFRIASINHDAGFYTLSLRDDQEGV